MLIFLKEAKANTAGFTDESKSVSGLTGIFSLKFCKYLSGLAKHQAGTKTRAGVFLSRRAANSPDYRLN